MPFGLRGILGMIGKQFAPKEQVSSDAGVAGGSPMGMVDPQKLTKEQLDTWPGLDPNSDQSALTQYHNAYSQQSNAGQPAPVQSAVAQAPKGEDVINNPKHSKGAIPEMFGQFGDPRKTMGSIWDQIKSVPGKLGEGISNLDKRMEEKYQASNWAPKESESPYEKKPWSIKDIPREDWSNYEMGILANPDTKGNEESLMKMAMAGEGDARQLDPDRWKMIQEYIADTKNNPYYLFDRDRADAKENPIMNQIGQGYIQGNFR